jgi:hypothetical protein
MCEDLIGSALVLRGNNKIECTSPNAHAQYQVGSFMLNSYSRYNHADLWHKTRQNG